MQRSGRQFFLVMLMLGLGAIAAWSQAAITAELEPDQIDVGGNSVLTLSVSGTTSAQVSVPQVDGLEIVYAGQQSNFTMINGQTNRQLNIYYHVRASRAGNFTIPPIAITDGDQQVESQPVQLRVAGSAARPGWTQQPTQQPAQQQAPSAAYNQVGQPTEDVELTNPGNDPVFVRLTTPKTTVYVGELVPIQIKLFVRADMPAKIRSLPTMGGNAFAMNKLPDEPLQKQESIDGITYQTAAWNTALSAVKSGEFPVSAEIPVTVMERQQMGHGGIFDDPFFALFSTRVKQVDKTFGNPVFNWKVLPLPTEGKPAGFTGAIGEFKVSGQADPSHVTVGDPVTMRFTVEGTGNFSLVSAPELQNIDGWKTYSSSNKVQFSDDFGLIGKKVFEQAIVPKKTGIGMPKAVFSWFSPEAHQYIVREITPNQVAIADAPPGSVAYTPPPAANANATDDAKKEGDSLVANKVEIGKCSPNLKPQILNPWLVVSQALSLTALVVGLMTARQRHLLENNPEYARAVKMDRRLRETLETMHRAVTEQNSAVFFTQAKTALQLRLGAKWKMKPEALTYAAIDERNASVGRSVEMIFHLADEVSYSGQASGSMDLADWEQRVRTEIAHIEQL